MRMNEGRRQRISVRHQIKQTVRAMTGGKQPVVVTMRHNEPTTATASVVDRIVRNTKGKAIAVKTLPKYRGYPVVNVSSSDTPKGLERSSAEHEGTHLARKHDYRETRYERAGRRELVTAARAAQAAGKDNDLAAAFRLLDRKIKIHKTARRQVVRHEAEAWAPTLARKGVSPAEVKDARNSFAAYVRTYRDDIPRHRYKAFLAKGGLTPEGTSG